MGREERLRRAALLGAIDPAIEPLPESVTWFESGPYTVTSNSDLATLIVRVGMASNALNAQMIASVELLKRKDPSYQMRDNLFSLVTTAALTNESIQLAKANMAELKALVRRTGQREELLAHIGKLCAGQHPASPFLRRARQKLGFHWDADVVQRSLNDFGKNKKLVWVESDPVGHPFHRLAGEVLAHAMFPEVAGLSDEQQTRRAVRGALEQMGSAIELIVEFFTAAMYGFMRQSRVRRKTR